MHPETGDIWENEHGPLGGDEINVLEAGGNYGWPLVSYGLDYTGEQITDTGLTDLEGMNPPLVYWVPSIAVSGLSFYEGEPFAAWQGSGARSSRCRTSVADVLTPRA